MAFSLYIRQKLLQKTILSLNNDSFFLSRHQTLRITFNKHKISLEMVWCVNTLARKSDNPGSDSQNPHKKPDAEAG